MIKQAGGHTTVFVYGFDGKIIAESDATGEVGAEYIYRGDNLLAKVDGAGGVVYYAINDYLGQP